MRDYKELLIGPTALISEAAKIIDSGQLGIALVSDSQNRLIGIVTDVDIRKGLVRGITIDHKVSMIMTDSPEVAYINDSRDLILKKLEQKCLRQIPVIDDDGLVVGVEYLKDLYAKPEPIKNKVVIMAGGVGQRMLPLTKETPKPLLRVGEKPILGTILHNLCEYGFEDIYLMVNYLSDKIEEYVNSINFASKINVIKESEALGTCGSLSLLPREQFDAPFMVMNADLLTNINFEHLMDFHEHINADVTMCVKEYDVQMPYGAVEMEGYLLKRLTEKPTFTCNVNAGIYVLNQNAFEYVPSTFYNMTDLCESMIADGKKVSCFPIREFWMDIGQKEDYERAQKEYYRNF